MDKMITSDDRPILQLPRTGSSDAFNRLITEGVVPYEHALRLAQIGYGQRAHGHEVLSQTEVVRREIRGAVGIVDKTEEDTSRLEFVMGDIVNHFDKQEPMSSETLELLRSDLPTGFVDHTRMLYGDDNSAAYASFDEMYWSYGNFYDAVQRRRIELGESLIKKGRRPPKELQIEEERRSRRIARYLWRPIVARYHPEWFMDPEEYCYNVFVSRKNKAMKLELLEAREMRGRILGAAVLSDSVVCQAYEETITVGFKGLGEKAQDFLRTMLSEEHPELSEYYRAI